jgi:hypothetical protein
MAEWNIQLIRNPIAHLLLQSRRFVPVSTGPIQDQLLAAENRIVRGKRHRVTAASARRAAIPGRNVRTPFITRHGIVNDAFIAERESHVVRTIVELECVIPRVERRLGHPYSIDREISSRLHFANAGQAFARWGVVGKSADCSEGIGRLNIKGNHSSAGLPGNRRAVNTVASDGIATNAVVIHGYIAVRRARVEAVP